MNPSENRVNAQVTQTANQLKNKAQASVQNFVGDKLNIGGALGNFVGNVASNFVSDVFGSFGFGKSQRGANLPQATKGKVKTPTLARFSTSTTESDWRVRISVPQKFRENSTLLGPLNKTNGSMIFPYTPTIILSHSANYNSLNPVHTNYPFQVYENSQADDITITGEFVVENAEEGQYWIACIHFLRSITKMFYGDGEDAGSPPMTVRLSGYGDYVFNNVPCVVTNFTVDLPSDVDYIAVPIQGVPGTDAQSEIPEVAAQAGKGTTWAPTQSQISVTLRPTYSRRRVSEFNLNDFVNGKYVNGGQGFI
jgi:hypothetical protein